MLYWYMTANINGGIFFTLIDSLFEYLDILIQNTEHLKILKRFSQIIIW